MGKKDIITKEYMEDTEVFADVFNHMIYKGEKVIDPKNLKELDTANVIIPYGANGAEVPYQKYRDVFKILCAIKIALQIFLIRQFFLSDTFLAKRALLPMRFPSLITP